MGNKTYIWLTVGISLLVLTSLARAQDEQWLQYHSEREAQRIIGDMALSHLEFTSEEPQDVQVPRFKGAEQFFTKWPTPMVESGYLWIALDRSGEQGQWDRLFIDSNGNGHLNDETAVPAYRVAGSSAYFGPVKVVFEVEDGPVTYQLAAQRWVKKCLELLWDGWTKKLLDDLKQQRKQYRGTKREALDTLIRYISTNEEQMRYDVFRSNGYDIGSGTVEAACTHVVGKWLKSGMIWSTAGSSATLALRVT